MGKITLKEVIEDIKSGKSKAIYLCEKSLWWTHLDSDLQEATESGIKFIRKVNPWAVIIETQSYSPIGEKIIVNKKHKKFIAQTQMRPQHFGKHGLRAFMKAHHKNTKDYFSNKWKNYNDLIDKGV